VEERKPGREGVGRNTVASCRKGSGSRRPGEGGRVKGRGKGKENKKQPRVGTSIDLVKRQGKGWGEGKGGKRESKKCFPQNTSRKKRVSPGGKTRRWGGVEGGGKALEKKNLGSVYGLRGPRTPASTEKIVR